MMRRLITILEMKVLRILKPDGHLLWTMKASQEDKSTEFGLFEQNLQVRLLIFVGDGLALNHFETIHKTRQDFMQDLILSV